MLEEAIMLRKFEDKADQKIMVYESPQQHGWYEDYSLEWLNEIYPTDFAKHLVTRDAECDYDIDSDDEDGLECDEDNLDENHKRLKQIEGIKLKFFLYYRIQTRFQLT